VCVELIDQAIGIASPDEPEDASVRLVHGPALARHVVVHRPVGLGGVPQQSDQAHGVAVLLRFEKGEVETAVRVELTGHVTGLGERRAVVGGACHPLDHLVVELGERASGGPLLKHLPELVDLDQVIDVELGDEVPATRPIDELALSFKDAQGLANRRDADSNALRDFLLAHPLSGDEIPRDHGVSQPADGVLVGRVRTAGRRLHGQ
jgi:hypothetical protein